MSDESTQSKLESSSFESSRYLTFYLEDEKYGIDIHNVREIIAYMRTTKIPKTPHYMKGVMNLRGNIIPVVDSRAKFNLKEAQVQMHTAIIIVQLGSISIGFVVDMVDEVLSVSKDSISETPKFGANIDMSYIKYMAKSKDEVIMILNLDSLLDESELAMFDSIAE